MTKEADRELMGTAAAIIELAATQVLASSGVGDVERVEDLLPRLYALAHVFGEPDMHRPGQVIAHQAASLAYRRALSPVLH